MHYNDKTTKRSSRRRRRFHKTEVDDVKNIKPLMMRGREESLIPLVVGAGEDGPPVEEDLDDLVVVGVGGQDEGGDVRGEGRRVRGDCLPALMIILISRIMTMTIMMMRILMMTMTIMMMTMTIMMMMKRIMMTNYPGFAFFVDRLLVVEQHLKKCHH